MVAGKHRSRSMRRVFRRTPGAETKLVFRARKPQHASCAGCGKALAGILRARATKMQRSPKTAKKTSRAYGGYYCSRCARKAVTEKARKISM